MSGTKPLRLLVVGHGRMGRAVAACAEERGHTIVARVSASGEDAHRSVTAALAGLDGARPDVAIDFTTASAIDVVVGDCVAAGLPLVTGTTGWGDRLEAISGRVAESGGTLLHAPNFSIAVQLFLRTVGHAAGLFARAGAHDVAVEERHHTGKVDAPSGTALAVAQRILDANPTKRTIRTGRREGAIADHELDVVALRVGAEFGRHTVVFDGPDDVVELRHTARSRRGFAAGAVRAAEWLVASGRTGVLTIDDMLDDLLAPAGAGGENSSR